MDKEKLLQHEIDDAVAKFIIDKMTEYQKAVVENAKRGVSEVKKDYSAKLITEVNARDRKLEIIKEEVEHYKKDLATKVSTFLSNTKNDIREIVAEEIMQDPKFGENKKIVDEIRKVINPVDTEVATKELTETKNTLDRRIRQLEENIGFLKGRIESKEKAIEILKTKNRMLELTDGLPSENKDSFRAQLSECKTVECVEKTFGVLKEKASKKRVFVEEVTKAPAPRSREIVVEEFKTPEPKSDPLIDRLQDLAGMK